MKISFFNFSIFKFQKFLTHSHQEKNVFFFFSKMCMCHTNNPNQKSAISFSILLYSSLHTRARRSNSFTKIHCKIFYWLNARIWIKTKDPHKLSNLGTKVVIHDHLEEKGNFIIDRLKEFDIIHDPWFVCNSVSRKTESHKSTKNITINLRSNSTSMKKSIRNEAKSLNQSQTFHKNQKKYHNTFHTSFFITLFPITRHTKNTTQNLLQSYNNNQYHWKTLLLHLWWMWLIFLLLPLSHLSTHRFFFS